MFPVFRTEFGSLTESFGRFFLFRSNRGLSSLCQTFAREQFELAENLVRKALGCGLPPDTVHPQREHNCAMGSSNPLPASKNLPTFAGNYALKWHTNAEPTRFLCGRNGSPA